jgi:hypothetical protein
MLTGGVGPLRTAGGAGHGKDLRRRYPKARYVKRPQFPIGLDYRKEGRYALLAEHIGLPSWKLERILSILLVQVG